MATKRKYRQQYLRWHKGYEKRALKILRKVFHEYGKAIDLKGVTKLTLETHLKEKAPIELLYAAYAEIYTEIGVVHKARVLKGLNLEKKAFSIPEAYSLFKANIIKWLRQFAGRNIVTVHKSYLDTIRDLITGQLEEEWTLIDTTTELLDLLNDKTKIKKLNLPWGKPRFYKWQSQRIARTETTTASNHAAIQAADDTGFVMVKEWISAHDDRIRRFPKKGAKGQNIQGDLFDHDKMNGVQVPRYAKFELMSREGEKDLLDFPGDPNGHPSDIINCYLPDTIISGNIIEGQKSFYSGKVFEIITSRGEILTITPNHGILTNKGFIKAKDIKIGDNLVCNKINVNPVFSLINNYIKKKLFTAENIFSSLEQFWSSKETMVTALDFDTDGKSMNGNINIVYPEIKLRNGFISTIVKYINKLQFKTSNSQSVVVARNSPFNFFRSTNKATFRRLMGFLYLSFPRLFSHFTPFKSFGFGLGAHLNTKRFKTLSQSYAMDSDFLRELIKTDAGLIAFDNVINVREVDFSGHVYDFSSYNGTNIANNIYTSNCRCAVALIGKRDENGNLIPTF